MAADELKVPFGKREDGSVAHISELTLAENGLRCKCVCPKCGKPLQARNGGKVRVPHFSHHIETVCEGAVESGLHLFAKEVFTRHTSVRVPEEQVTVRWQSTRVSEAMDVPYADVAIEQNMRGIIPDVVLGRTGGKPPLLIEVAVTHFADDTKREKLKSLGCPCIEIDLQDMVSLEEFDREAAEDALINGEDRKEWLFHPKADEVRTTLEAELRRKAEEYERKRREEEEKERRIAERRRQERERVMQPEYQQAMAERTERELPSNTIWLANRRAFGMPADAETPWYLNYEIQGEYLWTVHRTVWQSALFRSWVFNKGKEERSQFVSVKYAINLLHDTFPDIWERCLYWAWQDDRRVRAPSAVVGDYLRHLERCGFLRGGGNWGQPYSWTFECVRPKFILLPPEYNSPRYLPRDGGVYDTETGRDITL